MVPIDEHVVIVCRKTVKMYSRWAVPQVDYSEKKE
jgi:hypothetical protein